MISGKKLIGNVGWLFPVAGFFCLAAGLLVYPNAVKKDIYEKLLYCFTLLVPTVFPFIALASFAVNSSVSIFFGKAFGFLTRYVFRLPQVCAAPIIISFIGGYPSGASGISILLEKGAVTKKEAGRMLLFCVNPGIAFVVSFLGGAVLQSVKAGVLLYLSVVLSGLLVGALSALFSPFPPKTPDSPVKVQKGAFISSAYDASQGILRMVGCVMLFTAILTILNESGLIALLCGLIARVFPVSLGATSAFLSLCAEITSGIGNAAASGLPPVCYAFALAFGGLCVHLQTFSFFKAFPVPKLRFIAVKTLHGLLSALTFFLLQPFFRESVEVFSSMNAPAFSSAGMEMGAAGGISLAMMCGAFLILCGGKKEQTTLRK